MKRLTPQIVASECAAARFPQNSLSGFNFCLASGVAGIEFDVHLSRDGQVVVQHDYQLNKRITRSNDGNWIADTGPPVCSLTLQELKQYDVGRYQPGSRELIEYADSQPIDGEQIPTLVEFLDACKQSEHVPRLWVELKTSPFQRSISSDPEQLLEAVLACIAEYKMQDRVVLLAFEWNLLQHAKQLCPDIQTDYLTINPELMVALNKKQGVIDPACLYGEFDPADFDGRVDKAIKQAGGEWWGPLVTDVSAVDIAAAQSLGLKVNVWGVLSTPQGIAEALMLNADALTLSDPIRLAEALEGKQESSF